MLLDALSHGRLVCSSRRPHHHNLPHPDRIAHAAVIIIVDIQRGLRERATHNPDDDPLRITAIHLQRNLTPHPNIILIAKHIVVNHNPVGVPRHQPTPLQQGWLNHPRIGGRGIDNDAIALRAIWPHPAHIAKAPAFHLGHTLHRQRLPQKALDAIRPTHLHLHIVVKVTQRIIQRLLERGPHTKNRNKNRRRQRQRNQGQCQSPLAPKGVAERNLRRPFHRDDGV